MPIDVPEFEQEDEDPVIARLTQQSRGRQAAFTGRLNQVLDTNADQFAETKRTAKYLNAPPAAVEALPQLAQEAKIRQIRESTAQSPILQQKIAEDELFAKLAHDDTQNLSGVERTLRVVKNLGRSVQAALPQFNEGIYGATQALTELGAAAVDPLVGTVLPENPFGRMAQAASQRRQKEKLIRETLEQARGTNGATEDAIYSGVQSGANSLLQLPLAILSRDPRYLIGAGAVQSGGQSYGQARDAGRSQAQALPFAVSQATVEYATEMIPAIKLLDGLKTKQPILQLTRDFLAREIPGEQVATALQDLNEWATLNPDKPFSEYLKERPGAAYSTLVATVVGGSVQAGAGKAVDYAVRKFVPQQLAADAAQQNFQSLNELDQLATESKLRARDPESFQQFITSAIQDGPVSDVYIDPQTIAESGKLDVLAQVSPAIRDQFAEAMNTGSSIRIPFEEYATNIAGTPLNQGLMENIRLDPDGMTFAQSEQFRQSYADEFNKQVDQNIAAQGTEDVYQQSSESVKTLIKDQLNAAGHTSPSVNEAYSTMASAYYTVRAAQLGITPQEMFDRNPLTIVSESLTNNSFDQNNAAFRNWFGDSKVVDATGQPQIVYHGTTADFTKFKPSKNGIYGRGIYFSNDPKDAEGYSYSSGENESNGPIMPVYLSIKNPYKVDFRDTWADVFERILEEEPANPDKEYPSRDQERRMHEALKAEGYDGFEVYGAGEDSTSTYYIAFDGNQIKSAIGNRGTFDPNDPNILNQSGLKTVQQKWSEAGIDSAISERDGVITLSKIIVPESGRNQGKGTLAMQALIDYADATGQHIVLSPSADFGGNKKRLTEFYKRFGFVENKGSKRAFSTTETMYREAKGKNLYQTNRGAYIPQRNSIALLKNADLSTFLHELGHSFLAMDTDLALEILNSDVSTEGRQQILDDADTLMKWFGIPGLDLKERLIAWHAMDIDTQRPYHEKFAEGFEAYLFEGKAPRLDMQPIFQRFRAWLANVYRGLQNYLQNAGETLTPEVRSVMDRMMADTDEIRVAQQARGIAPLFATAEEAGMTPEAFDEYQRDSVQSSLDANRVRILSLSVGSRWVVLLSIS